MWISDNIISTSVMCGEKEEDNINNSQAQQDVYVNVIQLNDSI